MMANLTRFNLRDKGAEIWASWSRPVRTIFVLALIALIGLLPFAASWGPTSFLATHQLLHSKTYWCIQWECSS
jgi:branched-chain amino acid transport system permease protein